MLLSCRLNRNLRALCFAGSICLLRVTACFASAPVVSPTAPTLPQCARVSLQAEYLAEEHPAQGTGFLLTVRNDSDEAIAIADPTPLSVDWYAEVHGRWLWRASSGSGGSLVNALRPLGPLFAYQAPAGVRPPAARLIQAHASYEWTAFARQAPTLRFRPGCEHCQNPGEDHFRAVLSYAYLPRADGAPTGSVLGLPAFDSALLRCGLRSQPVVMPPLADSHAR